MILVWRSYLKSFMGFRTQNISHFYKVIGGDSNHCGCRTLPIILCLKAKTCTFLMNLCLGQGVVSACLCSAQPIGGGTWVSKIGITWRCQFILMSGRDAGWSLMMTSNWDLGWGYGLEQLQVASLHGWASSQHGGWVLRASILRVEWRIGRRHITFCDLALEVKQCHFYYFYS